MKVYSQLDVSEKELTPLTCSNTPNGTGVTPFTDDAMRDSLQVWVDGNLLYVESEVVIYKPKINAQVVVGNDHGYSGFVFGETGDGGSVILSLCQLDGKTLVGVIQQKRANQWPGLVFNAAAGMVSVGSNHFKTAQAESKEEVGEATQTGLIGKPICLDDALNAAHGNCNSTFWQTQSSDGGVHYYVQIVDPRALELGEDGYYHFKPGLVVVDKDSLEPDEASTFNKILGSFFMPINQATVLCGDQKTRSAIALLRTWLDTQ